MVVFVVVVVGLWEGGQRKKSFFVFKRKATFSVLRVLPLLGVSEELRMAREAGER